MYLPTRYLLQQVVHTYVCTYAQVHISVDIRKRIWRGRIGLVKAMHINGDTNTIRMRRYDTVWWCSALHAARTIGTVEVDVEVDTVVVIVVPFRGGGGQKRRSELQPNRQVNREKRGKRREGEEGKKGGSFIPDWENVSRTRGSHGRFPIGWLASWLVGADSLFEVDSSRI